MPCTEHNGSIVVTVSIHCSRSFFFRLHFQRQYFRNKTAKNKMCLPQQIAFYENGFVFISILRAHTHLHTSTHTLI